MPPLWHQWIAKIFSVFQKDQKSGTMSEAQFQHLYKAYHPAITSELVHRDMDVCGCADESGLKFANFARWVMLQFVDLKDIEFDAQMRNLYAVAQATAKGGKPPQLPGSKFKSSDARQRVQDSLAASPGLSPVPVRWPSPGDQARASPLKRRMAELKAEIHQAEEYKAKVEHEVGCKESERLMKQSELYQVQYEVDRYRATAQQLQAEVAPLTERRSELQDSVHEHELSLQNLQSKMKAFKVGVDQADARGQTPVRERANVFASPALGATGPMLRGETD